MARRVRWIGRSWPVRVSFGSRVQVTGSGRVEIGPNASIGRDTWLHAEGAGVLRIGARSSLGRGCVVSALGVVDIAEDVLLGPYVLVQDHLHGRAEKPGPIIGQELIPRGAVSIGRGAWIGSFAAILPGDQNLEIGENAVIGAGAIVTRSVAAGSVVVGPPSRVVGDPFITDST